MALTTAYMYGFAGGVMFSAALVLASLMLVKHLNRRKA